MENRKHQDFILKELFCAEKLLDGLVASSTGNSSEELEERLSPCKLPHFHTFNLKRRMWNAPFTMFHWKCPSEYKRGGYGEHEERLRSCKLPHFHTFKEDTAKNNKAL